MNINITPPNNKPKCYYLSELALTGVRSSSGLIEKDNGNRQRRLKKSRTNAGYIDRGKQ